LKDDNGEQHGAQRAIPRATGSLLAGFCAR